MVGERVVGRADQRARPRPAAAAARSRGQPRDSPRTTPAAAVWCRSARRSFRTGRSRRSGSISVPSRHSSIDGRESWRLVARERAPVRIVVQAGGADLADVEAPDRDELEDRTAGARLASAAVEGLDRAVVVAAVAVGARAVVAGLEALRPCRRRTRSAGMPCPGPGRRSSARAGTAALQPSPGISSPSSHCSQPSTMASPQSVERAGLRKRRAGVARLEAARGAAAAAVDGVAHVALLVAFEHAVAADDAVAAAPSQSQPRSTSHTKLQPSPERRLPSSHSSWPARKPSPQAKPRDRRCRCRRSRARSDRPSCSRRR